MEDLNKNAKNPLPDQGATRSRRDGGSNASLEAITRWSKSEDRDSNGSCSTHYSEEIVITHESFKRPRKGSERGRLAVAGGKTAELGPDPKETDLKRTKSHRGSSSSPVRKLTQVSKTVIKDASQRKDSEENVEELRQNYRRCSITEISSLVKEKASKLAKIAKKGEDPDKAGGESPVRIAFKKIQVASMVLVEKAGGGERSSFDKEEESMEIMQLKQENIRFKREVEILGERMKKLEARESPTKKPASTKKKGEAQGMAGRSIKTPSTKPKVNSPRESAENTPRVRDVSTPPSWENPLKEVNKNIYARMEIILRRMIPVVLEEMGFEIPPPLQQMRVSTPRQRRVGADEGRSLLPPTTQKKLKTPGSSRKNTERSVAPKNKREERKGNLGSPLPRVNGKRKGTVGTGPRQAGKPAVPSPTVRMQMQVGRLLPSPLNRGRTGQQITTGPPTSNNDPLWNEVVGRKRRRKEEGAPAKARVNPTLPKALKPQQKNLPKKRNHPNTAAIVIACPVGESPRIIWKAMEGVNIEDLGISFLRAKRAATGGYMYEVPGPEADIKADALYREVNRVLADEKEVRATRPRRMADIRVSGLDEGILERDIAKAVASAGECVPTDVKVGSKRVAPSETCTVWAQCPLKAALKVSKMGTVKVGWCRTRVVLLDSRPLQCFRCLEKGHVRSGCTNPEDRSSTCYRCGSGEHLAKACDQRDIKCPACEKAGRLANHRIGSASCSAGGGFRRGAGGGRVAVAAAPALHAKEAKRVIPTIPLPRRERFGGEDEAMEVATEEAGSTA